MGDTQRSQTISTELRQIAELAERNPGMVFTSLMYRVDEDFLKEAYRQVNKTAKPGIDGKTAREYAANLDENLHNLNERMRSGRYVAPPVKRVWLEEGEGKRRPIGISEIEDKIVQRAVGMLLEAVYEQDFYEFSHGYRTHQALGELREQCLGKNINWIVDADVSGFYDNLDHSKMKEIIKLRVKDGGVMRYIGKWLNAGVVDGETLSYPEKGMPQGGVISPILANIYLDHVLDEWFVEEVQPRLKGRSFLIRFADDFIIGCELESDARRVLAVLPKRLGRFGLNLNAEKTRLIEFGRPSQEEGKGKGTFDFLGFTHYWAKSRRGNWVIKRKTAGKRLSRAMRRAWQWCRQNRHEPPKEQYRKLSQKLIGHYRYYGVRGNYRAMEKLYWHVMAAWRYWLSRQSQKGKITLEKFGVIQMIYPLPRPRIIHVNI